MKIHMLLFLLELILSFHPLIAMTNETTKGFCDGV
nr:MAG TPA: hypothetical protein [Caudoviricetes sp.]